MICRYVGGGATVALRSADLH